jgi:hypothetical protein
MSNQKNWSLLISGKTFVPFTEEVLSSISLGAPGSGKSTLMKMNLCAVAARVAVGYDCRCIVYDPKNELTPMLDEIGVRYFVLNPYDERAVAWAIHIDINNKPLAEEFANIIIPKNPDSKESHWTESGQTMLVAVLMVFIHFAQTQGLEWDLRDVIHCFESVETLDKILALHPEATNHAQEYLKSGSGDRNDYLTTVQTHLQKFSVIAALWHGKKEKISLRDFNESESILHLGNDKEQSQSLIQLYGALMKINSNIQQTMQSSETRRNFLFIDEATDGAKYFADCIIDTLTVGRGFGCSTHVYIQNWAAMLDKFGKDKATSIVNLCEFKNILRVDHHTASWVCNEEIGKNQVVTPSVKQVNKDPFDQFNEPSESRETSISYTIQDELAIHPHSLVSIPLTSPENGLKGLFIDPQNQSHFHTYIWEEVQNRLVHPDAKPSRLASFMKKIVHKIMKKKEEEEPVAPPKSAAYQRIARDDPRYNLKPWTEEERQKFKSMQPLSSLLEQFRKDQS